MRDLSCQEFVELVSAYLDGSLDAQAQRRFVDHLTMCAGCEPYLDQFRQTICALGDAPAAEDVSTQVRDAVLNAFKNLST